MTKQVILELNAKAPGELHIIPRISKFISVDKKKSDAINRP